MSTEGKIKTLFSDKDKTEALFPRTKLSAVSDDNGTGLNALLDDMNAEIRKAPAKLNFDRITINQTGVWETMLRDYFTVLPDATVRMIELNMVVGDTNLSGGMWNVTINKTSNTYGTITMTKYSNSYGGKSFFRMCCLVGDVWSPWEDVAFVSQCAPAGYGLGESASTVIDAYWKLDKYKENGTYHFSYPDGAIWGGVWFKEASVEVVSSGDNCITQILRPVGTATKLVRVWDGNAWGEKEVENPPMVLGVEYRTTERWNGKPVYVIRKSMGALANNSRTEVSHIVPAGEIVRHECFVFTANKKHTQMTPVFSDNEYSGCTPLAFSYVVNWQDEGYISAYVQTSSNITNRSAEVTIWFTKSTD